MLFLDYGIAGVVWSRFLASIWLYSSPFYWIGILFPFYWLIIYCLVKGNLYCHTGVTRLQVFGFANRFWCGAWIIFRQWEKITWSWFYPHNALAGTQSRWTYARSETEPNGSYKWSSLRSVSISKSGRI